MKKDFEQAYRELAQNEAPDLWDRIEAGLSEKSTPVLPKEQPEAREITRKQNKTVALLPYRKYATVAAALLCVAILIPVAGMVRRSSGGFSGSDTAKAESASENAGASETADMSAAQAPASEESAAEAADGTTAQEPSYKYAENAVKEEAAGTVEKTPMEMAESADTADAGMAESMLQSSADSSARGEMADADKMMSDFEGLKEDEVISHVVIHVTEINHTELLEDVDEVGTLYTFLIEDEPSGILSASEEYVLFIPAYSSYAFAQDGTYEIDLGYREREEYSFVLKGYHRIVK